MPHKRIEDYGIIGDLHTVALVGVDGSIDWCCLSCFDSPSVFAALLDEGKGGYFKVNAVAASVYKQLYIPDTNVLVTRQLGDEGIAEIIDFMPIEARSERGEQPNHHQIVRRVNTVSGKVRFRLECFPAFDYARSGHEVHLFPQGALFESPSEKLGLVSPMALTVQGQGVVADFTLSRGESATFFLRHTEMGSEANLLIPEERGEIAFRHTVDFWKSWISQSLYSGRWREMVHRSALVLKLLTYAPTGAIVAAATTSLPEEIGGVRNWDYRYCWVRDATLTLIALVDAGYQSEAKSWREWLLRAIAGSADQMQIMYGVRGERRLEELELPWLSGYENSKPVRIGNAASGQFQLDVYGEVLGTMYRAHEAGIENRETDWRLQVALMNFLESNWNKPDEGIWEVRGGPKHFTHSKMMAWVAFDRAVKLVEECGCRGAEHVDRWRKIRDQIHKEVCTRGFSPNKKAFTQYYGSDALDASLLMMPLAGFLPFTDKRIRGTIEAIERELMRDGFVLRYRPEEEGVDGLPGREGVFLPCSFWLASCLHRVGRKKAARDLFERLLSVRNDLGLLSEEYDPRSKRQLGNFPQAFSHVSLITAALVLSDQHPSIGR